MRALLPTFSLLAVAGLAACDATPGQTDRAFSATGEIIAMGGGAGGAANACFTCHGLQGQGDGNAAPRLAGLDAGYLQKQMEDYASGLRQDDAMTRIAKALDQKGRRAVAAYYAGLSVPAASPPPSIPAPAIYSQGDPSRGVVACAACHGDQGQGTGRGGNPQIAGQPFAYTLEQIDRWKSGERRNDPRGVTLDNGARQVRLVDAAGQDKGRGEDERNGHDPPHVSPPMIQSRMPAPKA